MRDAIFKVKDFHDLFGLPIRSSPLISPSDDADTTELRLDLINEEVGELDHAIGEDDIVEVADALGDIMYVVIGAALSFGIDIQKVFDQIHTSNMSKMDSSIENAVQTQAYYSLKGVVCRIEEKEGGFAVYNSVGKVLKSIYYEPVNLHWVRVLGAIKQIKSDALLKSKGSPFKDECYAFHKELVKEFPDGELYYDGDHVITKINDYFYDFKGLVYDTKNFLEASAYGDAEWFENKFNNLK